MADTFYTQTDDDIFDSSALTAGPWDPQVQHAGPPSALLTRQIDRYQARPGQRLARVAADILAPIPVAPLHIDVKPIRQGKRVELLQASAQVDRRTVLVVRAWRLAATPADFPAKRTPDESKDDDVRLAAQSVTLPGAYMDGYMSAIDWCFERGSFDELGPAKAWARPTAALIDGESMTCWERTLVVADSGSGISLCLPPAEYPAINCDLTLVLDRDPEGDWIGLDARTTTAPEGGAMTQTAICDHTGTAGMATQTLLASRSGS